ncbi:cardiolipin synthase [Motilibacter rhizosphaerae]|uniref:Cardiolipin synthase n=1 Tax=Motilibacter rhizosphaerae TaxID=598652 RepID=A0A4V2F2V5_9ACTN|nr:CDP-alcohol phosphatidyltransferase family protein [Motilibacter rhizosphaerae]RZS80214.1 cardiolipin synthase [Motilibacter rhizosphaerae]
MGSTDAGALDAGVLTVPNALSAARLLGVPVFLVLVLGHHDGWALALLVASGVTDWLDGWLARRLSQTSRLGALLDPAADRLYIVATLVGLTVRGIIPLWLPAVLIARELLLSVVLALLQRRGYGPLPVHFLGKAATANLLYAFPLLLLGDGTGTVATTADAVGWAFAVWGTALYWYAGVLYVLQARDVLGWGGVPGVRAGRTAA